MRRTKILFWTSGALLFLAGAWAVAAQTTTVGAAILFFAGMALLIWALFDSGRKLAGYVVMGGWCALAVLGMVVGQRTSSFDWNKYAVVSQPNRTPLTATEEFDLRSKCAELGHQLEQAREADDAALQQNTAELEKLSNKLLDRHTKIHSWHINYNVARNSCYALDEEHWETIPADGSNNKSDPLEKVLYDAQTQEVLALISDEEKTGRIMRPDGGVGKRDYDAAKKFIDEQMGDGDTH